MSLTIKTEFKRSNGEVDIRRTRLIDGTDRYTQLITYLDSTYGALYGINKSAYVLSYVDPDGDACSVNSDAELLECCRCATEQGKTAKIRVKLVDDMSLSTSSLASSMTSSLMTPLGVSRDVSHSSVASPVNAAPSVSQPGFHQPSAPEVDSDSEYVQVESAPATPAVSVAEIQVDAQPVTKSEPAVPSVTVEDVTEEDRDENALVEAIMASFTSPAEPVATVVEKPNVVPSVFTTVSSSVEVEKKEESKVDSSSSSQAVHAGIVCDGCNVSPVLGDRFKCTICVDFDLCSKCENSGKSFGRHSAQHNMIKVAAPGQPIRPRCPVMSEPTATATGPSDVHAGVRCDGCSVLPIKGIRYKCTSCPNFDLCEDCEAKNAHDPKHVLLKMRHTVTGEDVQNAILNRVSHWWRRGGPHHGGSHGGHPHPHPHHGHHGHRGMWGGRCGRGRDFAGAEDANRPRAAFISDVTLQDGATVAPLSTFQKVWSIQNVGTTAWPEGSKLIFVGGDLTSADQSGVPVEHTNDSVPVSAQPNEIVTVKIDIQAPEQEGRFRSTFRLVTPDGEKFGPRMWIDLNVQAANSAISTAEARPEASQAVASPAVEHKSAEPIPSMPVAEPVQPQDSIRAAIQTIVGALGQQGGSSPINSFLDLIQGHGRVTPRASPAVASPVAEPFRYHSELMSIREMGVDASDDTLMRLLTRYNGSVPRTLSQIFEESN